MKIRLLPIFALLATIAFVAACGDSKPAQSPDLIVGKGGDAGAEPPPPPPPAQAEDEAAVPIVANDATRGSRLATVTIVVFSDFQCPFCSRVVPTLDRLYEQYGADQLRIVFKNNPLPFHPQARIAAEIGQGVLETAGNEAFWRFHNATFEHQKEMEPATLLSWAAQAGADERAIKEGIEQHRWTAKIEVDISVAHGRGANGTPTFFIDGIELVGARSIDDFKEIIDEELVKSRALAKEGIPRDQIYTRLAGQNFKSTKERQEADRQKRDVEERERAARDAAAAKIVHKIPVGKAPSRGNPNAQITIIEFADYQCPYCKASEKVMEQIKTTYGDKVRFVWRDFPLSFHPRAEPAAELARFALATKGEAGFWAVHDAIMTSTPQLEDSDLEAVATAAKLDAKKAMEAVKAKSYASQIELDQIVADDFGVEGTPNFFVNGRHVKGARQFDAFKAIIDEELVRADELLKKGTAKTALYEALIKDGVAPPEPPKKAVAAVPANAPFRGSPNAKVVIQEFADFQCPFCAKVKPTIDELLKSYPGKIKVVWRDDPLSFHPDAPLAAEAAREAYAQKGNEGFNKFTDLVWQHQQDLKRSDLESYAQQVGLDATKFAAALDKHTHKATIDAEQKAANDAELGGTPAFFIGPYFISGAKDLPKFKKLVNLALNLPADKLTPEAPKPKPAITPPTNTPPTNTPPTNVAAPKSLVIADTQVGTGREVKSGDKVKVHYVGRLLDGTEFDASRKHGNDGFSFKVGAGQVIKGWDQGLVGMKVGGKRKLTIPPDLGYGDRGAGSVIPPKATLVFDIELLSIE
ncbi:MAG: thioredoxin domain-containing protein [Labilithrix sp.]